MLTANAAIFEDCRKSVLLIDECHGLTKDQAQLFLKYVEDVSEHNYYIFCTTALDQFLPALRDRCAINIEFKLEPSHVLLAMGLTPTTAQGSVRFSLSAYNTEEEIDDVLQKLPPIIERLRSMSPLWTVQKK